VAHQSACNFLPIYLLQVATNHRYFLPRADIHQAEREVITAIKFDLCPHSLPAHLLAGVSADIT